MKTFYIPLLASALLAAACGQGALQFDIDNTKPVTPDNRVIYQMTSEHSRPRALSPRQGDSWAASTRSGPTYSGSCPSTRGATR